MVILTNPRERTRFFRFVVVGTIGAVVDFSTFNILRSLGVILQVAGGAAFILALLSNFLWNRYWIYPDSRSKALSRQLVEFTFVNLLGLGIRTLVLTFMTPVYTGWAGHVPAGLPLGPTALGENLALVTAVGIVLFWNFFINRYWTYGDVD
jgi:putative flippase GtrA